MSAESTTTRGSIGPRKTPGVERSTWRALVHFLPHAVLLIDDELHVVLANKAASRLFGIPAAQITGSPLLAIIPRNNLGKWLRDFSGQRTKVLEMSLEINGRHALKKTLRIAAVRLAQTRRAARKLDRSGGREYRLLVLEDITDRAAVEQQLVESEKQAAMGQLAAGILHEVANPLAGLGSNLVLVRLGLDHRPREVLRQALDVSIEQLNQMRELLGTLSGFPGRTAPAFEVANLVEVLQRSIAFITSEARRRRVRIESSIEMEKITCEMDARLIRQVLLNVLKNAIEALPDGGRIGVCARLSDGHPNQSPAALIDVTDSGVGIAETDLRKVFRPLFSTKPRGAGLGLSFCRQTIEEHGGYMRVTSPGLDRGTTVTICLPVHQCGAIAQDQ